MSIRIGDKIVAGMPEKALHGIGEIFTTTDTGVIAGAVEANGGSYNLADYNSGADSIASKLAAGTLSYVSKAEFQTQVANTGACDSFGWDGASDTTFLVPKLNPWHVGKSAPVVGNGNNLGLTNGTDDVSLFNGVNGVPYLRKGAYGEPIGSGPTAYDLTSLDKSIGVTTDPTKSGLVADLTETANLRVMVQLATGATDEALETCTSVLADVAGLKDMSNVTAAGKNTVVGWGMPDYSAGVSQVEDVEYTAPKAGILYINAQDYNTSTYITIDGERMLLQFISSNQASSTLATYLIDKGSTYKVEFGRVITGQYITFYPLKGVNNA